MIKLRAGMGTVVGAIAFSLVVAVVQAQDFTEDESLFAAEEIAMDEAVTGTLPEGEEQSDEDLFDSLFSDEAAATDDAGAAAETGTDDLEFADETLDPEAFEEINETGDAFESVDSDVAFPDALEETVSDAGTNNDELDELASDQDQTADEALAEMMAEGDQEPADDADADAGFEDLFAEDTEAGDDQAAAAPEAAADDTDADAGFEDLFAEDTEAGDDQEAVAPEAAEEDDFDALFGEWTDEEPEVDTASTDAGEPETVAPDAQDDATIPIEEKGAPSAVPDDAEDDFDSLFAELSEEEPVEEESATPAAPEGVDASAVADVPPPAEEDPAAADTADPEPETAPEPEADPAYEDELALDESLFAELAREGQRAANEAPPTDRTPPAPQTDGAVRERPAPTAEPTAEAAARPDSRQPDREAPASEAVPPVERPAGAASLEEAERMRRVARENHAVNSLARAEQSIQDREFRRAVRMFEEALRYLPRRADMETARSRARRGLGEAYYRQAESLEQMRDYEAALQSAQSAVRHGYRGAEDAVVRIKRLMEDPPEPPPTPKPPRWDEEEFERIDQEIEDWLQRGREAYLTGEYERAVMAFESVLARDPENKEAIRMMRAAANRQYDSATLELDATRARMAATVRDTWNPRQYGLHEEPIDTDLTQTATGRPEEEVQRMQILDKMQQIRIPEVNFRQANIRDVINFLHQQSVEFDPAEARADRTGVNIILKMDQAEQQEQAGAQAGAQQDFFAAPSAPAGGGGGDAGDSLITFSALDVTLKEALDIVVDVANLKYRIRGNVVMLLPQNAPEGDIEHRMYDVLPSAISRLQELSTAVQGGSGGNRRGSGDFLTLEGSGNVGGGEDLDLKGFFSEMGVEWPARSSIKFVRGLGKLVVANTQENLTVFEKVLSILNVVPYQIEIEARFVEVAQTDVDSLGLEWMLTDPWEIAEMAEDAGKPPAARRRIVMNQNDGSGGFTKGNRFLSDGGPDGPLGENIMDQVATVSSVLTNPELSMVLHALQQRGHTDLLSAPKITTQSGQQATIKVVTEYIYPTAFETTGIESGTDAAAGAATAGTVGAVVTPLDFATREVGVILEVLPEVSPEGQMINLMLSPEVVSEPTWKNYGSTFTSFDPNGNPIEQVLNMEQPFFHTRKLRTNLLIYNGATVVMGGMITEVRTTVDDKVPLLGDVPVLGRLFRSQYDSSEKRNLLIFVTARLVDPSGRPLDKERLGVDQSIAERLVTAE